MNGITWMHVAAGMTALASGAVAVAVRKGGDMHALAGKWFVAAMLVVGVTASILAPFKSPPDPALTVAGVMVCYFVATAWMTARRRDGTPGRFEKIACAIVLALAITFLGFGLKAALSPTGQIYQLGSGVFFALMGVCLLAGLLDLNFILRGKLSAMQRISRHLWRMCFAFFIATGSFFLGQQDVMPKAVRGSPILFVLAFAPFALMLFWLGRIRLGRWLRSAIDALSERPKRHRRASAIRPSAREGQCRYPFLFKQEESR